MYNNIYNLSLVPEFNDLLNSELIKSNENILKLNKVECRTNNSLYKVITYNKLFLSQDIIPTYGVFRSVVINKNNNVVGFAPPKSIKPERFIEKYHYQKYNEDKENQYITCEEFIEGTMINVFFDTSIGVYGGWEISTRNTVGATSTFYKSVKPKTFREMFMEAANENNLDINKLKKNICYSFVLQHPENRIVVPFTKPQLYLVGMYEIKNEFNNINVISYNPSEETLFFKEIESTVKFPKIYKFENYSELIEKYGSMNTSYDIVGVVIHNRLTGERTKIRNPVYEKVRSLRGNQPKLQYQYLCLRYEGKIKDYLMFYPENKSDFSLFREEVHLFTNTLYNNYVSCYIKKEKQLIDFPQQYRTHMYKIHTFFMNELREKKLFITITKVQKYVNELHPSLLMYSLNYEKRKRKIHENISCK